MGYAQHHVILTERSQRKVLTTPFAGNAAMALLRRLAALGTTCRALHVTGLHDDFVGIGHRIFSGADTPAFRPGRNAVLTVF